MPIKMEPLYDNHDNLLVREYCIPEDNKIPAEIFTDFFMSLSEYIQFLREWSCDERNLFSRSVPLMDREPLGDALPVLQFRKAVETLTGLVNDYTISAQEHDLDINLQSLRELAAMADDDYKHTHLLESLDQRIVHLQAMLVLLPPSHPERTLRYLQLGDGLSAKFKHTDEPYDLDNAISHYSEVRLSGIDKYIPLRGLAKCLVMRSSKVRNAEDLDRAMEILLEAVSEMPFPHPYRHAFLSELGSLTMEIYERNTPPSTQALNDAISYYRDALTSCTEISDTDMESISSIIKNLSDALVQRHMKAGTEVDAHDMANILQRILDLDPSTSPEIQDHLSYLSSRLLSIASDQGYSDEMIYIIRQFISLRLNSGKMRRLALYVLVKILLARFMSTKNLGDLDEAIVVCRDILHYLSLEESSKYREETLSALGRLLSQRFIISCMDEDSEEAISIYQDMLVSPTPVEKKYKTMGDYAKFLVFRFEKFSQVEDIAEAILLYRAAHDLVSQSENRSADRFELLFELAKTLLLRIEKTGEVGDRSAETLNEAIFCLRAAIAYPTDHVNYTEAKRTLSSCLLTRYEESNDPEDLNESTELSGGYKGEPADIMFDLSITTVQSIGKTENPQELEDRIGMYHQSLSLQRFHHPKRLQTVVYLGKALASLSKIYGGKKQLDEAILLLREAVVISPKSMIALQLLIEVLIQRGEMEEFSWKDYIDEIKTLIRQLILFIPTAAGGPMEQFVARARMLLDGDETTANVLDIIALSRELSPLQMVMVPLDAARHMSFTSRASFVVSGDVKYLDESIYHAREAARICPENHPQHAAVLYNIGNLLMKRYVILQGPDDIDEAIHFYFKSILCLQPGNYFKSLYLRDLGVALIRKFQDLEDSSEMLPMLTQISMVFRAGTLEASSSPVPARFLAAKIWALLADTYNHKSALEAYEQAINLLPRLSSMGTNVMTRQETFKAHKIDGLSRNAALFAIRIGRYDKAAEFLEAGRAVFWLQALQLRTPMERLRDVSPELEAKLMRISAELDRASMEMEETRILDNAEKKMRDEKLFRLEELNEEWSQTLDDVHQLEGFHDFLLPKKLSSLQATINRPVILLIPNEEESHALVILPDEVKHVELSNAPYEKLQELVAHLPGSGRKGGGEFHGVVSALRAKVEADPINDGVETKNNERAGRPRHIKHIDSDEQIRHVLQTLWNDVASPIVQALGLSKTHAPLKICWCPTGIFSFLPLHAAGIYGSDMSNIESASNYFISSYTPTIGALANDKPTIDILEEFKMMVVINQKTLPNTIHELKVIEKLVSPDCLIKFGTRDSPALVNSVTSNLSTVSIAHFACHGKQLIDQPLNSSLILEDGDLSISRIMEQRMPNAALAFLCACETAMGDRDQPDEAMHLGATLLFSGFRGVVATMWSIDDEDGPVVANTFYSHLFKHDPKNPDTALAAEGIQNATIQLRGRGAGFMRWVPFIHIGT